MHRLLSRLPLKLVLIVPFVAQMSVAIGLVAWLSVRNSRQTVDAVADELWAEITALTELHVAEYLQIPQDVIADTLAHHSFNLTNLRDPETLTRYLWSEIRQHDELFITAVGYETGAVVGVGFETDGQLVARIMEPGQTQLQTYALSDQGDRGALLHADDFDLKNRPWYRDAVTAGQLTWTEIYPNYDDPYNLISAVSPLYDPATQQLVGVTNATLSLGQISEFLATLEIGKTGQIFIMERNGDLVASSSGEALRLGAEGTGALLERLNAADSRNDLIRQTVAHLRADTIGLSQLRQVTQTEFWLEGDRHIVHVTPYRDDLGLDWLIVITVPASDFMAPLYDNTRNTLLLCLAALAVMTGSGIMTARWIADPLLQLNQTVKNLPSQSLASGEFAPVDTTQGAREINELSDSVQSMVEQIQIAWRALQASESNFRNVAANIPGAVFRYVLWPDGTDTVLYMSPGCYQLWEVDATTVQEDASVLWGMVDPEDFPAMQASVLASAETLSIWNFKWRITTPSGTRKWLEAWGRPTRQADDSTLWHTVILDISDRKQAEAQLQELSTRLELAVRSAEIGIWEWNVVSDRLIWDDRMYELYGISAQSFGRAFEAWQQGVHPDDLPASQAAVERAIAGEQDFDAEFRVVWPDGTIRHIEAHAVVIRDATGQPLRMIGANFDITERKEAAQKLQDLTNRLGLAVQAADMGIWEWDLASDRLIWDDQMFELYQIDPQMPEVMEQAWQATVHPDDLPHVLSIEQLALADDDDYTTEFRIIWPDGSIRFIAAYAIIQRDERGQPQRVVGANLDISDRKLAEEELIYRALHDALTDLPNRTLLMDRLELAIQRSHQFADYGFAVLFLDLDQFKVINDSLGHLVGDQLLVKVAHKLSTLIRPADLAARLGGDEFVILLEDLPDVQAAILMAERILAAFQGAMSVDDHDVFVTTSIGLVWGSPAYTVASDLLRDADIALYRAKANGRRTYEMFDAEMHVLAVKRMTLEHDLRVAIAQQQFIPYYQPIIDLKTQRLIGFEALIRWQHPTQGLVPPGDFIPIAEETGLILAISQGVLKAACQQLATWQQQFTEMGDLRMSVNLSGKDLLQNNLVELIADTLAQVNLAPTNLTLEVTESLLIDHVDANIRLLQRLQDLGIRISIDDFGTGYSSLSYLYSLPANYLKIDQSFVGKMRLGGKNYKIVQAVVKLSDQLGLAAIAEGIETTQQLDWLQAMGCEFGQGYLLAHPLSPEAATTLLAAGRRLAIEGRS
ncbi:EAL domain-containing protein [Leptolyngbya iicbica]|uniref:EAL domain-containing protein n=2 Tax=Cyanophyceae TaxID=3028117 RepID=A0A4Q7E5K8_9CYAN|nr:EAL domain-containing protein [Leptolyngbya sp. LK]RZM77437.1 EAL domain-containing protein [Leptolyngbya sp. LK]